MSKARPAGFVYIYNLHLQFTFTIYIYIYNLHLQFTFTIYGLSGTGSTAHPVLARSLFSFENSGPMETLKTPRTPFWRFVENFVRNPNCKYICFTFSHKVKQILLQFGFSQNVLHHFLDHFWKKKESFAFFCKCRRKKAVRERLY